MLTNPLIIGLGRAGTKWHSILMDMGYGPLVIDTDESKGYIQDLETAIWCNHYPSFALVCTPPDQHLANIQECLEFGLPVLCEKPLCGFGQLEEARKLLEHPNAKLVRVGYNYRYNPDIDYHMVQDAYEEVKQQGTPFTKIELHASQQRELSPWGIILDHMSHDVDLFRALFGEMSIETARLIQKPTKTMCIAFGTFDSGVPFKLHDEVRKNKCERVADICVDGFSFSMTPNPVMFSTMLKRFMDMVDGKEVYMASTMEDAIKTQKIMEEIRRLSE